MSLSPQEKNLLTGLVTGSGTPESNAAAQDLINHNPEAAKYHQELQAMHVQLETLATLNHEKLGTELPTVLAGIRDRVNQAKARKRSTFRRRVLILSGVAAALAIIFPAYFMLMPRPIGQLVLIEQGDFLNPSRIPELERQDLEANQKIETGKRWASLSLGQDHKVVLSNYADLVLLSRNHLRLNNGHVFLRSNTSITLECVDSVIEFSGGDMLIRCIGEIARLEIYSGKATLKRRDENHEVAAGSSLDWSLDSPEVSRHPAPADPPAWIKKILQALDE